MTFFAIWRVKPGILRASRSYTNVWAAAGEGADGWTIRADELPAEGAFVEIHARVNRHRDGTYRSAVVTVTPAVQAPARGGCRTSFVILTRDELEEAEGFSVFDRQQGMPAWRWYPVRLPRGEICSQNRVDTPE